VFSRPIVHDYPMRKLGHAARRSTTRWRNFRKNHRSRIQVAESSNLRRVSPRSRKRLRGEWLQDRLAEQRSLLAKSGAQFNGITRENPALD